jgi:hypothetical protein
MKSFKQIILTFTALFIFIPVFSQVKGNEDYYYQIPSYPKEYTASTVAARMIDGLGFRYYWATDGLREKDLGFRPNDQARTSMETLWHIYGLSQVIVHAVKSEPDVNEPRPKYDFNELRKQTLENFRTASDILKSSKDEDLNDYKMIFKGDSDETVFPFWNLLNGPIADVLWHVGQVVSFRRSSGNPFDGKNNVLTGKREE